MLMEKIWYRVYKCLDNFIYSSWICWIIRKMFRFILIVTIFTLVTANNQEDQDCLKSIEAKLIGYKNIVKEGLKVIKIKPRNLGENQGNNGNQANQTNGGNQDSADNQGSNDRGNQVDDRKTVVEQMNEMINAGNQVMQTFNPIQIISNANSNGGTQTATQVMNNMVTQIQNANQMVTGGWNQLIGMGEGVITNIVNMPGGGSARLSGSPAAMDALRDIQRSLNGIEGIARAIRDIFSEEPGNSQIFK